MTVDPEVQLWGRYFVQFASDDEDLEDTKGLAGVTCGFDESWCPWQG